MKRPKLANKLRVEWDCNLFASPLTPRQAMAKKENCVNCVTATGKKSSRGKLKERERGKDMSGKAQTRSDGHDSSLSSFFVRNLFSPAALPLFSQQLPSFHLACHTLGRCQSSFATGACRRKEKGGDRGAERRSVSVRERKKNP